MVKLGKSIMRKRVVVRLVRTQYVPLPGQKTPTHIRKPHCMGLFLSLVCGFKTGG